MSSRIIKDKNGIKRVLSCTNKRKRIIEENLMQYIDAVDMSSRNKDIVAMYVDGTTLKVIAEKYGISSNRVSTVVSNYIHYVAKLKRNK